MNSLKELIQHKRHLEAERRIAIEILNNDVRNIKKALEPLEIIRKMAMSVVPEVIRNSKFVNGPINFIAKTFFHEKQDVVKPSTGKLNAVRDIALGVLETAGSFLVSRYIRKKF